jgi:hypothetical protein
MVPVPSFADFDMPKMPSLFESFDNDFGFGNFDSI